MVRDIPVPSLANHMVPLLVHGRAKQDMGGAQHEGGGGGGGDGGSGGGGLLLPSETDGMLAFCSFQELYVRMRPLLLALQEQWSGFSCALVLQLLEGLIESCAFFWPRENRGMCR